MRGREEAVRNLVLEFLQHEGPGGCSVIAGQGQVSGREEAVKNLVLEFLQHEGSGGCSVIAGQGQVRGRGRKQ